MSAMKTNQHLEFVQPSEPVSLHALLKEVDGIFEIQINALATLYGVSKSAVRLTLGGSHRPKYLARVCYEYAVEGKWPSQGHDNDADWLDLSAFVTTGRSYVEHYGAAPPKMLEKTLVMGGIRAGLDSDRADIDGIPAVLEGLYTGYLTLLEIAIMAQMSEKSVRNATLPTAQDRLVTSKQGTRTVVEAPEALRWLSGRRSFNPTVVV
ncbi:MULTISPECIES: hypothetical protein [Pseudomonas]|uniref:hypothetical protein n=1 Tax=Pseudomonas TaxID=286 RepID=UPI000761B144|nr:hypothetical protein [Pseudomonas sp. NBRC 111140]